MMAVGRVRDIGLGAVGGAALTSVTVAFGNVIVTSGWTSGVCCGLLAACSACLAGWRFLSHDEVGTRPPVTFPPYVDLASATWNQSMDPEEWLGRESALKVDDAGLERFLAKRLGAALTPLSPHRRGALVEIPLFPERSCDLLLLVIAARSCGIRIKGEARDLAQTLLSELDRAHGESAGAGRTASLDAIRNALAPHLAPGGKIDRVLDEAWQRYGTRETLALSLLRSARKRCGILAVGEFTWLKGVDRGLWYALNNLGRTGGFHVEGLAAIDHFRQEIMAGTAVRRPSVGLAADALAGIARDLRSERAAA